MNSNTVGIKNRTCLESVKNFFQILYFCVSCADDGSLRDEDEIKEPMTRVKLGYRGKDIWIETIGINFHQTFGKFAVLLDQDDQVIPIDKNGELYEPLDPEKKYRVVVNRFGSSDEKWKQFNQAEKEKRKVMNKQSKKLLLLKRSNSLLNILKNNSSNNNNNNNNNNASSSNSEIEMESINHLNEEVNISSIDLSCNTTSSSGSSGNSSGIGNNNNNNNSDYISSSSVDDSYCDESDNSNNSKCNLINRESNYNNHDNEYDDDDDDINTDIISNVNNDDIQKSADNIIKELEKDDRIINL